MWAAESNHDRLKNPNGMSFDICEAFVGTDLEIAVSSGTMYGIFVATRQLHQVLKLCTTLIVPELVHSIMGGRHRQVPAHPGEGVQARPVRLFAHHVYLSRGSVQSQLVSAAMSRENVWRSVRSRSGL